MPWSARLGDVAAQWQTVGLLCGPSPAPTLQQLLCLHSQAIHHL